MRKSEIFNLEWNHVDFERGFILLKDPKSGQDQRIPINNSARSILEKQPHTDCEYVFPGRYGGPTKDLRVPFRRICDNAGLPKDFRPMHGLRHVFASTLASSGQVDMYTLQKLLTHKTPSMVQRYAHSRDAAIIRASEVANVSYEDMKKRAPKERKTKTVPMAMS